MEADVLEGQTSSQVWRISPSGTGLFWRAAYFNAIDDCIYFEIPILADEHEDHE